MIHLILVMSRGLKRKTFSNQFIFLKSCTIGLRPALGLVEVGVFSVFCLVCSLSCLSYFCSNESNIHQHLNKRKKPDIYRNIKVDHAEKKEQTIAHKMWNEWHIWVTVLSFLSSFTMTDRPVWGLWVTTTFCSCYSIHTVSHLHLLHLRQFVWCY